MGHAIVVAALAAGHEVVVVSGPVEVVYPQEATVVWATSTDDMLTAARRHFETCQGVIGVAAPCDYQPVRVADQKIAKTGEPLVLHLVETPDVIATLGAEKRSDQWAVGFALESDDHHFRAITKLHKKRCDLIVLNRPQAMNAETNEVEVFDATGNVVLSSTGSKADVGKAIFRLINDSLVAPRADVSPRRSERSGS
jgi:phosphopantothenoylcysteine decarboxylase/phosphopantothenate--cysteine ligase